MTLFPAFLKLSGRRCLVVGAGPGGEEKIRGLLRAGAEIRGLAPRATARARALARAGRIRWEPRQFRAADLRGVFLVVAATSSAKLHEKIYRQDRRHAVLWN